MRIFIGTALSALLLAGCGSTGGPNMSVPGFGARQARVPTEQFSYQPAANHDLRVTVGEVVGHENPNFIPGDPNWLQIRMTLSNVGSRTLSFTSAKEQLADGTVIDSASSAAELLKPPSMVATTAGIVGVGAAGMVVGALLFPPATLISGAAILFGPMFMADRMQATIDRVSREGLRVGPIAPGTSVSGYLFVPAVHGQTGLIVFYEVGGSQESLIVARTPN